MNFAKLACACATCCIFTLFFQRDLLLIILGPHAEQACGMRRYDLLPFCYMSFYVADRKFYSADVAANLYHSSAYYAAQSLAGAAPAAS